MLRLGTVRAIDTGMSGPDYGDLLHGESCEPGTPARYGLDLEAVLAGDDHADAPENAVVIPLPLRPEPQRPSAARALRSVVSR